MKQQVPLEFDKYYHIYNRGINGETLFRKKTNYEHFLHLYAEHIEPVAETYAWVLMKNHFHLLVRIFDEKEIEFIKPKGKNKNIIYTVRKKYNPTQQFGNLFNAYAKAFNKRCNRTGSLFETPFERIPVTDERYFKQLVYYIHNNPVYHGFCDKMLDYPWSSYLTIISLKPTKLRRDKVIGWFNSKMEFVEFHRQKHDDEDIKTFIID
jgi:putative transposase